MKFTEMKYERMDTEVLVAKANELIEKIKQAKSGEEVFGIHKEYYKLANDFMTNFTLAHIRHDIVTTDEFYDKENEFYDEALPVISNTLNEYQRALYESPYRVELEEKIGKVVFKNIELALKSMDEKLIPLMQEENALTSRYAKLLASAKIPFDGEIYNLSLMTKFTTSQDRTVRRRAYEAMSQFFTENQKE